MENEAVSITVIGGADGPTSIFLAGKIGGGLWLLIIGFVIVMLLLAALLISGNLG